MRFWCVFSFCCGATFMGLIWTIAEGDWVQRGLAIVTLVGLILYVSCLAAIATARPNPGAAK